MTDDKSNVWETDLLLLVFQNTVAGNVISALGTGTAIAASSVDGFIYVQLHKAAVSDTTATQNLATPPVYGAYSRQAIDRDSAAGGWNVSGNVADNNGAISFGENAGASEDVIHVTLGNHLTVGSSYILYYGDATLTVSTGVNPQYADTALTITET